MENESIVNLLWTGGWDSTFRLVDLTFRKKKTVQPFYLIDSDRLSVKYEILSIEKIKRNLFIKEPKLKKLILPTKFYAVHDIQPDQKITESFNTLLKSQFMGSQYDWLARFASEKKLNNLELCVHIDDKAHLVLENIVLKKKEGYDEYYQVRDKFDGMAEYTVFRYFRFPVFNLRKTDMQQIAEKKGFADIMELTWFCQKPLKNGTACGTCNPCKYTIEEGLKRRIPVSSRIRYYISPKRKIKNYLMKNSQMMYVLRNFKNRIRL